ncbi:DUF4129 domain-containing protein [Brachybacterium sp. ACRRE]|uniref:DUF4129 domain-containing protein n=1 Tax=Brachybacterium sp. ACRRE TaxID=2918184 RepID=UPI001EF22C05|nr:DUF4129 domain-containing protein [Brachybacterium sp. ACRRE]MCG7310597.1 DUF4129 domain-containing protein [Brachybacterium sp. ACRRE]
MHPLPPRSAAAATSLIALVALVCVVLGAGRVLGPVLEGRGWFFDIDVDREAETAPPPTQASQTPPVPPDHGTGHVAATVLLVLAILAGIAVLVLVIWVLRRARMLRSARRPEAEDGDAQAELLEIDDAHRALARARESLEYAATPRDAIIDAWLALERGIAEAGIVRRPEQTTTEYVVTVLRDIDLPDSDLRILAGLYGRALFDDRAADAEAFDEGTRSSARRALERLADRLQEVTAR